ncbi:MAG: chromophore lyase CpcT/CpeT [Leptolyngbyaceae cyanobacterium bins.59]|nr:chromophore lyase CpcT/CpeT [Leptolyngbyaceae cyanobacterium bins.59]
MNDRSLPVIFVSLSLWAVPAAAQTSEPQTTLPLDRQVTEVATRLIGVMELTSRPANNVSSSPIRMTTCSVKVMNGGTQEDAVFLYQEQAAVSSLDRPYRQRFLRIAPSATKTSVESRSFRPNQLKAWVQFCDRLESDRVVIFQDLGSIVCSVYLKPSGGSYVGRTATDGCPANYRGAVRITNRIVLYNNGMETWDRGYDASGKKIWGAAEEAYQFRRITPP